MLFLMTNVYHWNEYAYANVIIEDGELYKSMVVLELS